MTSLAFTKMHGHGNDFVVIADAGAGTRYGVLAVKLCDRHRGVGADGLIVICPSDVADCRMRIFNSDGSEAQMCGNGIRCVGKYVHDNGLVATLSPMIDTMSGLRHLTLYQDADGTVGRVAVDMGVSEVCTALCRPGVWQTGGKGVSLTTSSGTYSLIPVSVGNPHGVIFVDNAATAPVDTLGPLLECHEAWPEKANIGFVSVEGSGVLIQRTWERGVGETEACGTGACAAAVAAVATGRATFPVDVVQTGGTLHIDRNNATGHIVMTGGAKTVFSGVIDISLL